MGVAEGIRIGRNDGADVGEEERFQCRLHDWFFSSFLCGSCRTAVVGGRLFSGFISSFLPVDTLSSFFQRNSKNLKISRSLVSFSVLLSFLSSVRFTCR